MERESCARSEVVLAMSCFSMMSCDKEESMARSNGKNKLKVVVSLSLIHPVNLQLVWRLFINSSPRLSTELRSYEPCRTKLGRLAY